MRGTTKRTAGDTWWLPRGVVALRVRIFEKVNGDRTVTLPSETHGPEVFERVYAHPAANGRSAGAGLSDLFWYWLSPGPEVHQEHLEPGERYEDVAATTRRMLAGRSDDLMAAATRVSSAPVVSKSPWMAPGGILLAQEAQTCITPGSATTAASRFSKAAARGAQ